MKNSPVRVMLVDEHEILRFGLRKLLEGVEGVEVVGEAGQREEALALIDQHDPDVLIVGIVFGNASGIELARHAAAHHLKTRVMIFSMLEDECRVLEALHSGVAAYVLKTAETEEIVTALRWIARGHRYVSPPLLDRVLQVYSENAVPPVPAALEVLTPREREIITIAGEDGLTNAQIGAQLHISPRTAEGHRASAMRKLGLHNHIELAHFLANLKETAREPQA